MKNILKGIAGIVLTSAISSSASASILIGNTAFTYNQNFDSLANTGTPAWTNNSTIPGWSLFIANGSAAPTYATGTGSSNAGSFYSFGAVSSSERAFGGVGSGGAYFGSPAAGTLAGHMAVAFTNNTGSILDSIAFGFNGEQWRDGGNTTAQSMILEYGFGGTFASVGSWTAPGGNFNWTSPVATSTAAPVDGNVAGRVSNRGGTLSGLSWANGNTLWVRWQELNDSGNDHGLAIDDFAVTSVTPEQSGPPSGPSSVIPEPSSLLLGGFGLLALLRRRR